MKGRTNTSVYKSEHNIHLLPVGEVGHCRETNSSLSCIQRDFSSHETAEILLVYEKAFLLLPPQEDFRRLVINLTKMASHSLQRHSALFLHHA